MEYITVTGDKGSILRSIQYYQSMCFVGIKGVDALQKEFMSQYIKEYKEERNLAIRKAVRAKELKSSDEKGIKFENNSNLPNVDSNLDDNIYVPHGVIIGDIKVNSSNTELNDYEYVPNGVIIDMEGEIKENIKNEVSDEDVEEERRVVGERYIDYEYVPNGVIIDGNLVNDNVSQVSVSNVESVKDDIDKEYVNHGVIIDISENNIAKSDIEVNAALDNVVVTDNKFEDTVQPKGIEASSRAENPIEVEKGISDKNIVPVVNEVSNIPVKSKGEGVSLEKDSYKNVRDFVKKNPGCSAKDIREYFSVKEIQKALMGSKIVEKRSKYYVV